jgi:colanic acid/amylovoran biosynthesis glycosyltransferase
VLTVAYLANLFPSPVEPYVVDEIEELHGRGVHVIAGSVRRPAAKDACKIVPDIVLQRMNPLVPLEAAWLCLRKWNRISHLILRVLCRGDEGPCQRIRALLHTWLGACYAVLLQQREVDHIHVHHGYFGSWIAMVAARLLGIGFSLTLHGSDLLTHGVYLDVKLQDCAFCFTISEFNRRFIVEHFPGLAAEKILLSRIGVEVLPAGYKTISSHPRLALLAVGRLHAVKNHAFLIRACAELQTRGVDFECSIAGDGPERSRLESLIQTCGLEERVFLLGHVPREQMDSLYARADVVVLTSHSEGIPLVLMEAMARGKIVLAPAITGIPELVIPGKTGFLYQPGSMDDFVDRLLFIRSLLNVPPHHSYLHSVAHQLDWVRHAAEVQVRQNFNRKKNLKSFGDLFIARIAPRDENLPHANLVLQQI